MIENDAHLVAVDVMLVAANRLDLLQFIIHALPVKKPLIGLRIPVCNAPRAVQRLTLDAQAWKQLTHGRWHADLACLWKSYNAEL
jgi:hypothetical protein